MTVFAGGATYIPVVGSFCFAGNGDVCARFGFQVVGLVPVDGYVFDKLEGVHESFVVFGDVGCHLQWAVHGDIQCQLASDGGAYLRVVCRIHLVAVRFEDAWCVVHRSAHQTGERQDGGVIYLVAAEGFIFGSACGFVAD